MRPAPKFATGAQVQRASASEEVGVVLTSSWNSQAELWTHKVQFGATPRGGIPESSLRHFVIAKGAWDAVRQGSVSGITHFRHALTYHRVRRPPSRIAKSFSSARTRFYPHQFKPLLKFLDNPEKRILIGDDVGLCKTIEAEVPPDSGMVTGKQCAAPPTAPVDVVPTPERGISHLINF